MASINGVDKYDNSFPNYVLNISFCEVMNTNEASTSDVDDPVSTLVNVRTDFMNERKSKVALKGNVIC